MRSDYKISVVIPCYNEEKGIAEVIPTIPDFVDEIVVVDNNSSDKTAEVAASLGARVVTETRQGYGAAYKCGMKAAKGDVIVTMDGDGTYPAHAISYLFDILMIDKLKFISAARIPIQFAHSLNMIQRYMGNITLTIVCWLLFGIRLRDSQSGMWVFKKDILDHITVESDGMPFSEEFKMRAFRYLKDEAREVPVQFKYLLRIGPSKLNLWGDGIKNLLYLFKLRMKLSAK
jgi:glycosyltransferase involved in cell wall biosynthesis